MDEYDDDGETEQLIMEKVIEILNAKKKPKHILQAP